MDSDDQIVPSAYSVFEEILTISSSSILHQTVFKDGIFALRFSVLGGKVEEGLMELGTEAGGK